MYNDPNQQPQQPAYTEYPAQPPLGQPQQPPLYGPYYGPPPMQGYIQPPPQKPASLRWLWITLGIVGGLLLLACVGCGIAGVIGFNYAAKITGPALVSTRYYNAVRQQDYTTAYNYMDSTVMVQGQPMAEQDYIAAAQNLDIAQGTITKSSSTSFTVNNTTADVVMSITRAGSNDTYTVHMQLKQVGNTWKIISIDRL